MARPGGADSLADVGQLLDPAGEVGDPGGDTAGVRDLVAQPGGGDHAAGQGGYQGPVVVGLLLAAAGDGHHVLQVLPHGAQKLHTKVDLPFEESKERLSEKFFFCISINKPRQNFSSFIDFGDWGTNLGLDCPCDISDSQKSVLGLQTHDYD